MKECTLCKKNQPLSEFYKKKKGKNWVCAWCKECFRNKGRERYQEKRDELLKKNKIYYKANFESMKEYQKKYQKEYEKRPETKRKRKIWDQNSSKKNILQKRIRAQINGSKKRKFIGGWTHIPYSPQELAERLKSTLPDGYIWEDYLCGNTDLQIDHIRPISSWSLEFRQTPESIPVIWALENLQLLPKKQNREKWDNYDTQPL